MIANYLSLQLKQKKLLKKLSDLKAKKADLLAQLKKTQNTNRKNSRRSDRKFKENKSKALSARNKRANKSGLLQIEQQIKFTQSKLNQATDLKNNAREDAMKRYKSVCIAAGEALKAIKHK